MVGPSAANSSLLSFKISRQILIQLSVILQGGNTLIMLVCCYPADGKYGGKAAQDRLCYVLHVWALIVVRFQDGGGEVREGFLSGNRQET